MIDNGYINPVEGDGWLTFCDFINQEVVEYFSSLTKESCLGLICTLILTRRYHLLNNLVYIELSHVHKQLDYNICKVYIECGVLRSETNWTTGLFSIELLTSDLPIDRVEYVFEPGEI